MLDFPALSCALAHCRGLLRASVRSPSIGLPPNRQPLRGLAAANGVRLVVFLVLPTGLAYLAFEFCGELAQCRAASRAAHKRGPGSLPTPPAALASTGNDRRAARKSQFRLSAVGGCLRAPPAGTL